MISLSAIPSYVEPAAADLAVDSPVYASLLTQLSHNAKFAMVRREVFQCIATNGDTIAAPKSPIDGYQYSYAEITFWWTRAYSYSPSTSKPSGSGCVFQWTDSVSSAGVVSVSTNYFIDGGADTPTNDGELVVFMLCQRNSTLKFTAVPTWSDVEDADLAGGQALLASNLAQMAANIRYACVRKEFFVETLQNGQSITPPTSPVDGYVYQGQIAAPAAPTLSQVAGGTLAAATYYAVVTLVDPQGETPGSAQSSLAVAADYVLSVTSPAGAGRATGYNVYVGAASGAYTKQNTSPLPLGTAWQMPATGLITGAAPPTANTTISEMQFLPSMISSLNGSGGRSGSGCVKQFGCVVGGQPNVTTPAVYGQVSSYVQYQVNGGVYTPTNDGQILVLIIGTRERGNPPIPPSVRIQPPPATNTKFGTYAMPQGATVAGFPVKGVGDAQTLHINTETADILDYLRHAAAVTSGLTQIGNFQSGRLLGGDAGVGAFGGTDLLGLGRSPLSELLEAAGNLEAICSGPSLVADGTETSAVTVAWSESGGVMNEWRAGVQRGWVTGTGRGFDRSPATYPLEVSGISYIDAVGAGVVAQDSAAGGALASWGSDSGGVGEYLSGVQRRWALSSGHGFDRAPTTYEIEASGQLQAVGSGVGYRADDTGAGGVESVYYSASGESRIWRAGSNVLHVNGAAMGFFGAPNSDPLSLFGVTLFDVNAYMRASLGPHSTALNKTGNIPSGLSSAGGFSYNSTPGIITVWRASAMTVQFQDGSTITIPANGNGSNTWDAQFSSLTPGATYYIEAWWNIATSTLTIELSDVNAGAAPASASFVMMHLRGDGNICLLYDWQAICSSGTTTSGSGGGSGGSGGRQLL